MQGAGWSRSPITAKERYSQMGIAFAMGQGGGAAAPGSGGFLGTPLVPIILMLAIMWFFLIRPQQKKQKEHRAMISNLKKGDRIITSGGLHGRVTGVSDATLTVEIADKVRVKVNRAHVAGLAQQAAQTPPPEKEKPDTQSK
jgi:preprotein translocase subunit YajC